MAIYLVENEEAVTNNWGCYWLVKANSAKEAIDRVYREENYVSVDLPFGDFFDITPDNIDPKILARAARATGILKRKLTAVKVDDRLFCGDSTYRIW